MTSTASIGETKPSALVSSGLRTLCSARSLAIAIVKVWGGLVLSPPPLSCRWTVTSDVPLAEGVENQAEADACLEVGFELGQGYFFGRPAPLAQGLTDRRH